jgi:serine protease Do
MTSLTWSFRRSVRKSRALARLLVGLCLVHVASAYAQRGRERIPSLSSGAQTSGDITLRAFGPVSANARSSVVEIIAGDQIIALGTIVESNGRVVTKASELPASGFSARLGNGNVVAAAILAIDETNDVALVQIDARGLRPIRWQDESSTIGQWVISQGIGATPEAVGIVSSTPRKILPPRALIGVILEENMIGAVSPGLGADRAGIQVGDRVLSVEGRATTTGDELRIALMEYRHGTVVRLRVRRGGEEFDIPVEMTAESTAVEEGLIAASGGIGRLGRRAERMNRMGSGVSERAEDFEIVIQHDTVIEPWSCGGPLLDLDGRALGINIARAGRVATYALPAPLVRRILEDLTRQAATGSGYQETGEIIMPSIQG